MNTNEQLAQRLEDRLSQDTRVDQASLSEKLARISAYRATGQGPRADDLLAELRVADRLLTFPALSKLTFGETPDIDVVVAGEPVGIEVKRFRPKSEDEEAELLFASSTALVAYGDPEVFQSMVCRAILEKAETFRGGWVPLLFLVSDSTYAIEVDLELRIGAGKALALLGASSPFGAVLCGRPPDGLTLRAASITQARLGRGARAIIEALAPEGD